MKLWVPAPPSGQRRDAGTGAVRAAARRDAAPKPLERERTAVLLLLGLVGAVALLHAFLVPVAGIRWDEFRFLEDVHSFRRGTLSSVLQTFHVHPFRWLPAVAGNEVDQVVAARAAYYVLLLGSCGLVYLIGKRFLSSAAALFAVLCYLAFNEVVVHATSFRFDGLSAFLLLAATAALLYGDRFNRSLVLAGGLTAIALLVTAKSIFYLPTLCIVALLRRASAPWQVRARDLALFGGSAVVLFVIALALHRHVLAVGSLAASTGALHHAGNRVLALDVLFPARRYIVQAVILNPIVWFFLLIGVVSLLRQLRIPDRRREVVLLLSLLLPLGSLVFYRNAFSYYFVFLMPAALVVAGVRFDEALQQALRGRRMHAAVFVGLAILGVMINFAINYASFLRHDLVADRHMIDAQRQVVGAVHEIFPEPVPYIDAGSMIASFPKVGFFMSSWGFQNYRDRGGGMFPQLLREARPQFLLANQSALSEIYGAAERPLANPDRFDEEDIRVLRDNFIPHWGPVYVLGRRIAVPDGRDTTFEILVPGPYALEAQSPVVVNGRHTEPGGVVELAEGVHALQSPDGPRIIVLRWAMARRPPPYEPLPLIELRRARPVMRAPEGVSRGATPAPRENQFTRASPP